MQRDLGFIVSARHVQQVSNSRIRIGAKGIKRDRGTGSWGVTADSERRRGKWVRNVHEVDPRNIAAIEEMMRHNPVYFRGARVKAELAALFPGTPLKQPQRDKLPPLPLRERMADLWYRLTYP